jgi:hypothetical protein
LGENGRADKDLSGAAMPLDAGHRRLVYAIFAKAAAMTDPD